tara:strand:+ start:29442 stop:30071 length:630 start_codon:yes stop_codon:yes gene_type:complete
MKKMIVLAAIAGLASGAVAQNASLSIVASSTIPIGGLNPTATLSVYADADFGTHITGAAYTLSAVGGLGLVESIEINSHATWGSLGFDDLGDGGAGNHNGMIMGQITFLPFIVPDAASALGNGPVLLGSFAVTFAANQGGVVDWTVGGGLGTFALEVIDVNANPGGNPPGEYFQIAAPDFGSTRVVIFPTPSSAALLGIAGVVAGRRRR